MYIFQSNKIPNTIETLQQQQPHHHSQINSNSIVYSNGAAAKLDPQYENASHHHHSAELFNKFTGYSSANPLGGYSDQYSYSMNNHYQNAYNSPTNPTHYDYYHISSQPIPNNRDSESWQCSNSSSTSSSSGGLNNPLVPVSNFSNHGLNHQAINSTSIASIPTHHHHQTHHCQMILHSMQ